MQGKYLGPGLVIPYTPSGAKLGGDIVVVGTFVGMFIADCAANVEGALYVDGNTKVRKAQEAISFGAALYWDADGNPYNGDAGTGCLTTTSTGNTFYGFCSAAAAETDEFVNAWMRSVASAVAADVIHSAELGVTAGTVTASRALVPDANKDLATLRNLTLSGALTNTAGAATPAVAARFGKTATEGLELKVYDETIQLTNAVKTDTTLVLPAGAVVIAAQLNLEATITGDGSGDDLLAKIGLGMSGGDEDAFDNTADLVKNTKINNVPDWAVSAGGTVSIFALKTDGATACTEKFTGGAGQNVRVRIAYLACNGLDDAA